MDDITAQFDTKYYELKGSLLTAYSWVTLAHNPALYAVLGMQDTGQKLC